MEPVALLEKGLSPTVDLRREKVKQTAAEAMAQARKALEEKRAKEAEESSRNSSKPKLSKPRPSKSKLSKSKPKPKSKSSKSVKAEKPRRRVKPSAKVDGLMKHLSVLAEVEAENTQIRTVLRRILVICEKLLQKP